MPLGFGGSSSNSSSSASGSSQGSTFVDQSQAPFLDFLRNMGMGGFGGFQTGAGIFGQQAQGLFGQGQQMGQQANPFMQFLQGQAGGNPELVAQQTQQLGTDLGQFFNEQILPGISSGSQGAGQLGGGRQGVAQGIGAQGVMDAFSSGVTGFQTADAQRAQQAAQFGGNLFNQGQQTQQQGMRDQFGFAQGGFESMFAPLQFLAQLFGDPTVLSSQSSQNQSRSNSSSGSFSVTGL